MSQNVKSENFRNFNFNFQDILRTDFRDHDRSVKIFYVTV